MPKFTEKLTCRPSKALAYIRHCRILLIVISEQIKRVRAKAGLSQSEFAAAIGVSVRTLQDWEQGRRKPNASAISLLKLAESGKLLPKRKR
jgi:DNA-binding transcriptional regulator YiaG